MTSAHAAHAHHLLRESLLLAVCVFAYFGVRGLTEGRTSVAVENAGHVVDLERSLSLYHEHTLQDVLTALPGTEAAFNIIYIWGHWPVIIVVAWWLLAFRPRTYFVVRNAMIISGAIGLVIFALFPVAPPRLAELGFDDTITQHSHAYRVLQPPAFVNQFAAMPSLHFGWDLLVGGALFFESRRRGLRVIGLTLPVLMAVAVVATANHFILDVFAGGVVALTGLAVALEIRRHERPARTGVP